MTQLSASTVPVAVRVRNGRYDGMLTGYLHGAVEYTKTDPGGYRSGSFVVDQRLGFRSDMIQPYSRVYFYDKRGGSTVFEGDVTHPGRSVGSDGALLEVQVEGGAERLNDWSGPRIYIDRDMTAWTKNPATSVISTEVATGDDRGGSGDMALTLAFPQDQHVDTNYRVEAAYVRLAEAGQTFGWLNYAWDGGHNSGSPGWIVRSIVTPPSTVARSQVLSISGSGGSGAEVGGSIPVGANYAFLQLIWTSGSSSTGTSDAVWVSFLRPIVIPRLKLKDGVNFKATYADSIDAVDVWNDLLGDQLADTYDGTNATVETGSGFSIQHMVYPEGVTPEGVAARLMEFEPAMTYMVGASVPGVDTYSFRWFVRSTVPRYEFVVWVDDHTGGVQPADQFNEAVAVWRTPVGTIRQTVTSQSIPEMTAVGRTRRYYHDLGQITGDELNAPQQNAAVLEEHRYPRNGGRVTVSREIVDLFTGRRIQPYEIEPGYLCRLVGVDPTPDALNASASNGASVCRIVGTSYSGDGNSADLDLDSVPWSLLRAINRVQGRRGKPDRVKF